VSGFSLNANDRYWPVADTQGHEMMVVRAAASDPKRTFGLELPEISLNGRNRLPFQPVNATLYSEVITLRKRL
jgi:hypothetical protein